MDRRDGQTFEGSGIVGVLPNLIKIFGLHLIENILELKNHECKKHSQKQWFRVLYYWSVVSFLLFDPAPDSLSVGIDQIVYC